MKIIPEQFVDFFFRSGRKIYPDTSVCVYVDKSRDDPVPAVIKNFFPMFLPETRIRRVDSDRGDLIAHYP